MNAKYNSFIKKLEAAKEIDPNDNNPFKLNVPTFNPQEYGYDKT